MNRQKLIVWFNPQKKRIQKNQFHIEANSNFEAMKVLRETLDFKVTILGISVYNGLTEKFKNKTIY